MIQHSLRAVLWDMDGTLVDTEPYWMAAETELVAEFGGVWTDDHAKAVVGFDLIDSARYIRTHSPVTLSPPEIVERLLDGVIARLRRRVPWRPGARELLAGLRSAGIPSALVTMSWRRFVEAVLDELPAGSFAATITGDEVTRGKPHPQPYLAAAAALHVSPAECLVIEDSPTGVAAAEAAGCVVLSVPNVVDVPPAPTRTTVHTLAGVDVAAVRAIYATARAGNRALDGAVELPLRDASGPVAVVPPGRRPPTRRRWQIALGATVAVTLGATVTAATLVSTSTGDPPATIYLDAWAPSWTLDDTVLSIRVRRSSIRELSPFWFQATDATTIAADPNTPADDADYVLTAARSEGVSIVPSIVDAMPPGGMAAVLADPATRTQHVEALVAFAASGGYEGIDVNYETFAFGDGPTTWAATRPNWVAFIDELAARLHDDGRILAVSVPPVYDGGQDEGSGYWVYDHGAIAESADRVRIMAYDYSVAEPGPIAPLSFVREAIDGAKDAIDDDSKIVLGIGVYGYNWPVSIVGTCPADESTTRLGVTALTVDELVARRGASPVWDESTGEWSFTYEFTSDDGATSCTQTREVHYLDAESVRLRMDLARQAGLGGVALWAYGFDDAVVWDAIGPTIRDPRP
jgi:HAD superfamily hydrolase (TIGR01509 family)